MKTDGVFKKFVRCPNQKPLWIWTKNNCLSHSFLEVSYHALHVKFLAYPRQILFLVGGQTPQLCQRRL